MPPPASRSTLAPWLLLTAPLVALVGMLAGAQAWTSPPPLPVEVGAWAGTALGLLGLEGLARRRRPPRTPGDGDPLAARSPRS